MTYRDSDDLIVNGTHPDANDDNDGSEAHPFKTVTRGLGALTPGGTLRIRPADYLEKLGEVELEGTEDAPILVACDPGVRIRPTIRPLGPAVPVDGAIWAIPADAEARVIESPATWSTVSERDANNGVLIEFARPMPTQTVETRAELDAVVGSSLWDPEHGRILVHPFHTVAGEGVELLPASNRASFRGGHFEVTDLVLDYATEGCQAYQTVDVRFDRLRCCNAPIQFVACTNSILFDVAVDQVACRGDTFEWTNKGSGRAIQIDEDCSVTVLQRVLVRNCWNGTSINGYKPTVDELLVYNCPNHGFCGAGRQAIYRHVKAYRGQEGMFCQEGDDVEYHHCELDGPLVIGGGYTVTDVPMTRVRLHHNTIFAGQINASADSTIEYSNKNYFVTKDFDYRYQGTRAQSLEAIRSQYGLEVDSTWDNRTLPNPS